jgi:hypothetical protein
MKLHDRIVWVCIDTGDGDILGVYLNHDSAKQCAKDLENCYNIHVIESQLIGTEFNYEHPKRL